MGLKARDRQILWGKSAGRCAFPNCRKELTEEKTDLDREVLIGEIAHIVSGKTDGPRGDESPPGGEIDAYENTILLCREHHRIIDSQVKTYPVAKLVQMRTDHEEWVRENLSREQRYEGINTPVESVAEPFYSTLLPVVEIPEYVYLAPCSLSEKEVQGLIDHPADGTMLPFVFRGGNLLAFNRLTDESNPFARVIDPYTAEAHHAPAWWDDPDKYRWYVELLNRALNKLTGRKGLNFDRAHRRYYFEPEEPGVEKAITYTSLSGKRSTKKVCWNPKFKHSGEPRPFWKHRAVGLQFHWVADKSWCLSIRPGSRFTKDGFESLQPKNIGRRASSEKSRMYNLDVLKEVQFWRDYLSDSQPRIICRFGGQSLIVDNTLIQGTATWPPIVNDLKNHLVVAYEDDLFSLADLKDAIEFEDPDDLFDEEWVEGLVGED